MDITDKFIGNIIPALAQALHLTPLLNFIFMLLILIFVAKKIQEGDFITWKTIFQLLIFIIYLSFFNWVANNPTTYMNYFGSLINYPADTITNYIAKATQGMGAAPNSSDFKGGIDWLIQQSFETAVKVIEASVPKISLFSGWQGSLVVLLCAGVFFIITAIFIIVILLIIIVANIQITIWKGLGVLFVILMFFPQTRQMVSKYILMLIGLTMYKPMLMTVVFFNYQINQFVITNLPPETAFNGSYGDYITTQAGNTMSLIGYLGLAVVGVFISTYLVKQVPDFINNIIGAGGGVGKAISNMGEQAMAKVGGLAAGAAFGLGGGAAAKMAYQGSGGGIGGLVSGATAALTGGATSALKGTKGGEKLNDLLNQSKAGSVANNAVSKGIETGSTAIKNLSNKYSGKSQ
ncbi:type IV secretion system protein [Helicobacter canis]|uniref:type IV secretion system protein n=1 Tax=Helicobacter canis TaxID=29419 RepID=UPI0029426C67|nr:type IV secretion system protein [Helicobacter canis]